MTTRSAHFFVTSLQQIKRTAIYFIHQCLYVYLGHAISRTVGLLAYQSRPKWLIKIIIDFYFIRLLKVNLHEAQITELRHYKRVIDFFTRELKKEVRPIAVGTKNIISPCDGTILTSGITTKNHTYRIKKQDYPLPALLRLPEHNNLKTHPKDDPNSTAETSSHTHPQKKSYAEESIYTKLTSENFYHKFIGGHYVLIYLSPRDCHRIYTPLSGNLICAEHLEGHLYPVRENFLGTNLDVFGRNRKLRLTFQTPTGYYVMIWVGAFNVGTFQTTFDPYFYQNKVPFHTAVRSRFFPKRDEYHYKTYKNKKFKKGDLLGAFELGSSVLLFLSHGKGHFTPHKHHHSPIIKIGEAIGVSTSS
ncbi:phosphatidylserine decarboxylase proenzyme [Spirochaetota bacterium]|nr:phosphatidylserine decarboxylase proenzyme [Spirochaetota bacterium]